MCIACHSNSLIGIDVVDISTRSSMVSNAREFVSMYHKQLSDNEVAYICNRGRDSNCDTDNDIYTTFYIYWSLKESYIKAIGIGFGIDLQQVVFTISSFTNVDGVIKGKAKVCINQEHKNSNDWEFTFFSLDVKHVICIATGPIADCIDSYKYNNMWDTDINTCSTGSGNANSYHHKQTYPANTAITTTDIHSDTLIEEKSLASILLPVYSQPDVYRNRQSRGRNELCIFC